MVAARLGCNKNIGIDNDRDGYFKSAKLIAKRLNINNVKFIKEEIKPSSTFASTDIVDMSRFFNADYGRESSYLISL